MDGLEKMVILIDADNTQLAKLEAVIREISARGRIVVKRAYGNWQKDNLKNWESELKRLAIRPEQQFDYVKGKNATDIALVIDAVNLLHREIYDAFAIVASDSDYTPLVINLHESGVYVMGVGEEKTPESFRNSCDEFIFLENLDVQDEAEEDSEVPFTKRVRSKKNLADIEEVHKLIRLAYDKYQGDDGYAYIGSAGSFLKRAKPDFDARTFGFVKLSQLLQAFPDKYDVQQRQYEKSSNVVYRCLSKKRKKK